MMDWLFTSAEELTRAQCAAVSESDFDNVDRLTREPSSRGLSGEVWAPLEC